MAVVYLTQLYFEDARKPYVDTFGNGYAPSRTVQASSSFMIQQDQVDDALRVFRVAQEKGLVILPNLPKLELVKQLLTEIDDARADAALTVLNTDLEDTDE